MTVQARYLSDGQRLHLQHGPIDLIIGAEGPGNAQRVAFAAATQRFQSVLQELVNELPVLRRAVTENDEPPKGEIAQRMEAVTRPHAGGFITRMAAVAGAVADEVLTAMRRATPLTRAYVNNGGDIALHLDGGQNFVSAIQLPDGSEVGRVRIDNDHDIRGIASSGRHGRSHSFGIADTVTVLARNAAQADAAATLIANAVDLPGHPHIHRRPADDLDPNSDLGSRLVVTGRGPLSRAEVNAALATGLACARMMRDRHLIHSAALCLDGAVQVLGDNIHVTKGSMVDA